MAKSMDYSEHQIISEMIKVFNSEHYKNIFLFKKAFLDGWVVDLSVDMFYWV